MVFLKYSLPEKWTCRTFESVLVLILPQLQAGVRVTGAGVTQWLPR